MYVGMVGKEPNTKLGSKPQGLWIPALPEVAGLAACKTCRWIGIPCFTVLVSGVSTCLRGCAGFGVWRSTKKSKKGTQDWKEWSRGAEADTLTLLIWINLVQFTKSQQAGGWHSFCKSRRHFKATSDPLLCQAVLAVPVECWRAACRLQACSRIRSEARHNAASSTRRFNVQESFICILKLVNGRLKVLPQTDFCMKGLQKMIRRKRLARGMMLFILDTCCPRCEYPEQCLVLKWRWQCRNSPFQWLGSCKGLPPGEEVVFSNVLPLAWPNAVQVGTAPRALLFPSAESCLEG